MKDDLRQSILQKIQEAEEKQLQELDLSNNYNTPNKDKLTEFPQEVLRLKFLKKLNLSYNKISDLPEFLGNITSLNNLNLSDNSLSSLPESIGNLTSLNNLNLSGNKLMILPESIGNLTSLNNLNLSGNKLMILPDSIGNLTSLNTLDLYGNKLMSLPDSIGNLTSLSELYLWRNQLTSIPKSLGNLASLNKLNLRYNQLTSLPEFMDNLTSLTEMYLERNQLTSLPESLGNLTSLKVLYLGENQLTSLPESLGNLTSLKVLYLGENHLTSLPESLGNLTSLNVLYLRGNPLQEPPLEMATKGVQAIKQYFEQLRKEGQDYIYEAKLLIVGEGGAGKTTLANKILDPEYQLRESEPTTEGIDVIKWSFKCTDNEQKERKFKVNIWDFGGQEIYHATHQFFLTKRSLYSLVADSRKEDTDFYYWLNIVELLSDNSPLLIIKNEKQDRKREINEPALRGQFTNLKETLATNLATNRSLDEILYKIKHYIQNLPHIGQTLPKTWVKVKQALENDLRDYIPLQEYLEICETNGFTELKNKLQLSEYLHDLGVCLHFQDEEDSLLYKTVILKPEWGTDAVYKVLDNPQVINNQGHFTRNDLKNIWQEEKYASMRGELLELMKKFQLCYEVPESKGKFIAPQLLSDNQPEYDWNETNNLILRYAYPDFMPKGIVTRFIVIMHQYIEEQKYVWKTGVILNKDNTRAEVIENYGRREIRIRVIGNNKRDLMTIVTHEIDKINNSYKRMKYQQLIPCNCQQCKNNKEPHLYSFNVLRDFAKDRAKIQCQKSRLMVDALSLIDNAIDIKQLITKENQYRDIFIVKGNYNEHIQGDSINQKGNIGIGKVSDSTISDNAKIAGVITETAGEIKQILNQLSQNNPTETPLEKMMLGFKAIEEIEKNSTLKPRIINALKVMTVKAFMEAIDHPLANVLRVGIEAYRES
ncbi:MAG: COR domain-containing protein [Xenococcus sp. (in: cyanobacteria)]